jgi:hypothetical protein
MNPLKQSPIFKVIVFMLALFLLVSIACGSNNTAQKVGEVKQKTTDVAPPKAPDQQVEVKPTEAPAQTAETNPTEVPVQPTEILSTDTPPPQAQTFKVGDIVTIGNSVLVVLGWEDVPSSDLVQPDEGKKFIAVEALIVNQGESPAGVSSLMQMSLKDDTGQQYKVDFKAIMATQGASIDGEISPGERLRGKIGFQVPVNAPDLQFVFDPSVFGASGKAVVDLGTAPVKVEPPAQLAGETQQQTFKVGDVVKIGTLNIIINGVTPPQDSDFAKPSQGNKFLIVDMTLENKGQNADNISTMIQMSLKDASGQSYKVDFKAMMASGGTSPDGELAPGEKVRGQVGFEIPTNATDLVFVFDADIFGSGKAFIALP